MLRLAKGLGVSMTRLARTTIASKGSASIVARSMVTRAEREAALSRSGNEFPYEELYSKLTSGLQSMKESNQGFKILHENDVDFTIDCGNGKVFTLHADKANKLITFSSPKNGLFNYKYDSRTSQWSDVSDKHFLLELLTRDLIYYAKSFPTF